jgi:hypothetical protein
MRRVALTATLILAAPATAQDAMPPEVRAVIERSRHPTTDYTNVQVIRVVDGSERFTTTSAEYHGGGRHRTESNRMRMLVDCETDTATVYNVASAQTGLFQFNRGMCGITDGETVLSSRLLPAETGPWGRTDVIELTGPDFVRRYAVTEDGIVASANYLPRRPDFPHRVETLYTQIRRGSPDAEMFEEASLARAYAPPPERLMPPAP